MTRLEIIKARITAVYYNGMKVVTEDSRVGFIRRWDIDWRDPYIDIFTLYEIDTMVDAAVLGTHVDRNHELILSIKHVKHDPWIELEAQFSEAQTNKQSLVRSGTVREILTDRVYIGLEDLNVAVLYRSDLRDYKNYNEMSLIEIFAIGDQVKGVVRHLDNENRLAEFSISFFINMTFQRRSNATMQLKFKDVFGDKFEQLLRKIEPDKARADDEFYEGILTQDRAQSVFFIENDRGKAEELLRTMKAVGISKIYPQSPPFAFSEETKEQYEAELFANLSQYSCIFIDKHLGAQNGTTYAKKIMAVNQDHPIIFITAEHPHIAIEKLKKENIYDKVYLIIRPFKIADIMDALNWAQKQPVERRLIIKERQMVHAFASANEESISEKTGIENLLLHYCGGGARKAFILEMDPITMEMDLLMSSEVGNGLDWNEYKSTLRHTPLFDIIKNSKAEYFDVIPETRKKHFPADIRSTKSMFGIPVEVFGCVNYGVFVVDLMNAMSKEIYLDLLSNGQTFANLLERFLFRKEMLMAIGFKETGILYSSLRHDLLELISGLRFDILKEWDDRKARLMQHGSEGDKERTEFRNGLKSVMELNKKIEDLFTFYIMLDKKDEKQELFDVAAVISETLSFIKSREDASGINFIFNNPLNEKFNIYASKVRIRQILVNIILNAYQQINQCEMPIREVTVEIYQGEGVLPIKIRIRDTGPGIHRKDFKRIFSPLFTTKKKRHGIRTKYM